jgi:hypothetical protein
MCCVRTLAGVLPVMLFTASVAAPLRRKQATRPIAKA